MVQQGRGLGHTSLVSLGPLARNESQATAGSLCQAKRGSVAGQGGGHWPWLPHSHQASQVLICHHLLPPRHLLHTVLSVSHCFFVLLLLSCALVPELSHDPC